MRYRSFGTQLLTVTIFLAIFVILLGAYTRLTEAGLGCPDWPGCYGHLIVPQEESAITQANQAYPDMPLESEKAWIEMVHRYFAGTLGLLIFCITAFVWADRKKNPKAPVGLATALSILVIFQAVLGMWTVTWSLLPLVVVGHLLGGMTTFALLLCLWFSWTDFRWRPIQPVSSGIRTWAMVAFLVVLAQIFLGGWTSTNYAALSCPDLPTCQGQWLPELNPSAAFDLTHPIGQNYQGGILDNTARVTIHFAHRIGAIVVFFVLGALVLQLIGEKRGHLQKLGVLLGVLLLLQIALGISNILLLLPIGVAVLHNGVGALLFATTLLLNIALAKQSESRGLGHL